MRVLDGESPNPLLYHALRDFTTRLPGISSARPGKALASPVIADYSVTSARPFIPASSAPPETSREEHPHPFHLTLCLTKEI